MTKKTKAIRTIAAVTAAALLGGGIYLLVKNDVAQKINWQDILIYAPTPIARETLDEAVNNSSDKPSADRVPEDTKKELTAQVRQLSNEHSDSVAWLYKSANDGNEYAQAMLDDISKFENDLLANTIFSLFVSLSRCIQDSYDNDRKDLQSIVDRKLMRVIRKKKMELGEKEENHMDIQ